MNNKFNPTRILSANVQVTNLRTLSEREKKISTSRELAAAADTIAFLTEQLTSRLKKSELAPVSKEFKVYSDPGHSWLAVKVNYLEELGIDLDQISNFSYRKGGTVYLEEDSDAAVLVNRLTELGQAFTLKEIHHKVKSPIRTYASLHQTEVD